MDNSFLVQSNKWQDWTNRLLYTGGWWDLMTGVDVKFEIGVTYFV